MDTWELLGADVRGIYVRLHRGDAYVDVMLPPTRDYFENDGQDSEYITNNFERLWDAHATLGPEPITIVTDKEVITANGLDAATVTATIPIDAEYCFVTVNGPPAERADIINGEVVREFTSSTVGVFKVEFFAGNKVGTIFIEAVA